MNGKLVALMVGLITLSNTVAYGNDQNKLAGEARSIIKGLAGHLKGALVGAMQNGGPVNALGVCNQIAIPMTTNAAEESGWKVARTSLKLRNTSNKPDDWERAVLAQFEAKKAAGANSKKLEHSEIVTVEGKKTFRFMKAIPTGKACLHCHGVTLKDPVKAKIAELYPEDKATGFKLGDIRGAFTLSKELK